MKHLALLFLFSLSGCIDNSSDSSTSNKTELMPALQGNWISVNAYITNGNSIYNTYEFNGDSVKQTLLITSDRDQDTSIESNGSFEVLDRITTDSGLAAYKINLLYNRDNNNELKKSIFYIKDDQLFWGKETPSDTCEGDTYTRTETITENTSDGGTTTETQITCYVRSTSLELSSPYKKY
jgi:hypothetical protein